jgi:hypothetical protein
MQALLEEIDRRDWQVAVPAGAVAQAWRGGPRQARIAALLSDERAEVVAVDDPLARADGLLCGRSGHADVVDVSVAACERQRNLHVVTSDPDDLRAVDDALILHVPCRRPADRVRLHWTAGQDPTRTALGNASVGTDIWRTATGPHVPISRESAAQRPL